MKFADFQLDSTLIAAIEKLGFSECTPIQAAAMPPLLEGKDVSGLAQTGTGKTAAFLIPLMNRILKGEMPGWTAQSFVLILVPTRELAEQVYQNILTLSEFSGLKGCSIYGGTSYDKQKEALRNGVQFIVATPGRLIDLYKEHLIDLKQVRAMVFDEADRMFDMGFKDDMKYILQRVPKERQIAVFSATLNFDVLNTIYQFSSYPVEIDVSRDQPKAENVKDEILHLGHEDKPKYLLSLIKKHNPRQVIVFSNFKNNVEVLTKFLNINNVPAVGISSLLTQAQRNRVLEQFKSDNDKNIMVATDVAARGLDIKGVDMVINYELPMDAESYVHRIGRTGRAGAEGVAISLVCDRDVESLQRIEDYLKHKLAVGWIEDTELLTEFRAPPAPERDRFDRPRSGGEARPPRTGDRGPRRERGGDRPAHDRPGSERGNNNSNRGERSAGAPGERRDRPGRAPEAGGGRPGRQPDNGRSHEGGREPHGRSNEPRGDRAARGNERGPRRPGKGPESRGPGSRPGPAPRPGAQEGRGPSHSARGGNRGGRTHLPAARSQGGFLGRVKAWFKDLLKSRP